MPKDATTDRSVLWRPRPAFRTRRSEGVGTLSACSRIARRHSSFPVTVVRRQGPRHCWSLSVAAQPGAGAERRREEPDTSPRSRAAGPADDAVRSRAPHSLLCPPRHNVAVCGPRYRFRPCDRQMLQAPSSCRVPGVPEANRRSCSSGSRHPYHHGQLRHSQNSGDQNPAGATATLPRVIHANIGVVDQSDRALVCRTYPEAEFVAASISRRSNWKRTSAHSSTGTTKIPGHTDGPNPPTKSSRPSNASAKRQSKLYAANYKFT